METRPFLSALLSTENTGGGTLTGAPALVSSQLAVLFSYLCVLFHMQRDVVYLFTQLAVVSDPDILRHSSNR